MNFVEIPGDAGKHQRDDGERDGKDELLAERHAAQPNGDDCQAEHEAAAENAPIDRPRRGAVETDQERAGERDGGHGEPKQKDRLVAQDLREPAREARDRQDPRPQREPTQHLDQTQLAIDFRFRSRRSIGAHTLHHFRGHGVGDDVLKHDADHDHELRRHIERVLAGEGDPAAGRAGESDHSRGDEARADEHIDATLGAENWNGVGELPEHHLHGPRQGQPHGERGQFRRREGECLLHPKGLGNTDESQRAIGVIDHEQRQIAQAHGADGRHQRRLQSVEQRPPLSGFSLRCSRHGLGF